MPKSGEKPSAHLYPEGGPGRQLKGRLKAGEVLVGGIIFEYTRPPLVRFYQQAGFDFIYIEYEHMFMDPSSLVDTVQCAAADVGPGRGGQAHGMWRRRPAVAAHRVEGGDSHAHRLGAVHPARPPLHGFRVRQQRLRAAR